MLPSRRESTLLDLCLKQEPRRRGLVSSETVLVSSRYLTGYNDTSRPADSSRESQNTLSESMFRSSRSWDFENSS